MDKNDSKGRCPGLAFQKMVSGKYKIRILWDLKDGARRYGEIRSALLRGGAGSGGSGPRIGQWSTSMARPPGPGPWMGGRPVRTAGHRRSTACRGVSIGLRFGGMRGMPNSGDPTVLAACLNISLRSGNSAASTPELIAMPAR